MKISNIKYFALGLLATAFTVSCDDDDDVTRGGADTDFSGTFVQEDQMGRPGINTVFPTTEAQENAFNTTLPSNGIATWQPVFSDKIDALYAAYSNTFDTTLEYESNVVGLDQATLTTALSLDVLQVAPEGNTAYFTDTSSFLTGRNLGDDVIDISLILLFGGESGARFAGQELDGSDDDDDDETPNLPNLVSDNVGLEAGVTSNSFPYLVPADF